MSLISNSGHDENNRYHGGKAGDQTGTEWYLRTWYNRPWNCVCRHPNANVRATIADLGVKAARNNKIGYDQWERTTYWNQLQKAGYDPSKITVACEADCSAGVMANIKATGYILGITALKNVPITSTYYMRNILRNAGFQILTDSKYLTSADYLLPGDILLNDNAHTATNIEKGKYATESSGTASTGSSTSYNPEAKGYLTKGDVGSAVRTMQTMLIACGYSCGSSGVDGSFGNATLTAVKAFQRANGLAVDGFYGSKTKAALTAKYNVRKGTSSSSSGKISVDGSWGKATTIRLQAKLGTSKDGIISGQPVSNKKYLSGVSATSWEFKSGKCSGSNAIRALQRLIGTSADGYFGKGSVTALQKYLKARGYYTGSIDGSCGSGTVRALQNWLNS